MAFPAGPGNGSSATINGIVYTYNSTKGAWYKQSTASTNVPVTISGTLSVSGNANVGNLGSPTVVNGNSNVTVTANSDVSIAANGAVRMTVAANGNVGIGTSSPANRFEVYGNSVRNVARASTTAGQVLVEAQASDYWSGPTYTGTSLIQNGSTATGTNTGLSNAGLGVLSFQNVTAGLILTNGASPIVFATTSTEAMRIDSSGNVGIGTSSPSAKLVVAGNILPSANVTYNLGSATARWSTVYTGDLELSNGIGDYTIVEGEDDLFLYNNRSGKTYRFMLQEVDPAIVPPKKGT